MTAKWRLSLLVLCLLPVASGAASVTVQNLRQWRAPDHTRLVFDLSAPLEHRLFTLSNPDRVVIDIDNAQLAGKLPPLDASDPRLGTLRAGRPDGKSTLRIVLDLKKAIRPRTFVLKPAGEYGHRLVIDLYDPQMADAPAPAATPMPAAPPRTDSKRVKTADQYVKRDLLVAIDAGHGGEDPGAIGRRYRTKEKDVTLAVARELARMVNATSGMRALLIRDGDYYIKLRDRYRKADRQNADIFVSIHADALPGRRHAYGASVYALSQKGAGDRMARILADKENAADEIGGVNAEEMPDDVQLTMVDLKQSKAVEHSLLLGQSVISGLDRVGPVHYRDVRQAGFAVLKSIQYPSILVETAFISNPSEEKKLRTRDFQQKLARGILDGVKRFVAREGFDNMKPVPTTMAAGERRQHVVQRGETLRAIASQYGVDVDVLRFANNLHGDAVTVGSRLEIP